MQRIPHLLRQQALRRQRRCAEHQSRRLGADSRARPARQRPRWWRRILLVVLRWTNRHVGVRYGLVSVLCRRSKSTATITRIVTASKPRDITAEASIVSKLRGPRRSGAMAWPSWLCPMKWLFDDILGISGFGGQSVQPPTHRWSERGRTDSTRSAIDCCRPLRSIMGPGVKRESGTPGKQQSRSSDFSCLGICRLPESRLPGCALEVRAIPPPEKPNRSVCS
jgi:hypothetical protein